MNAPPHLAQVEIDVPRDHAWDAEAALSNLGAATALAFDEAEDPIWRLRAVFETPPERAAVLVAVAAACGGTLPEVRFVELVGRDWVAESYRGFPPIKAGRFHVRGSHVREPSPRNRHVLTIDAATAFGTGEHASTRGCLLALDELGRRGRPIRVLDMGCGSGILGLAAARAWKSTVVASDLDPEAARVTTYNARLNRLAGNIHALAAPGYGHRRIRRGAPYDLILSNILARPLCRLAADLARHLRPGGHAVLAGFLRRDAARVCTAHRTQGLRLVRRVQIDDWTTLILVKPGPTKVNE